MKTINIEKLEELINEKWNFNKKKFKLEESYMVGATVVLHMLNNKENTNGEEEDKPVFWVNEKNYKELEFYGLKVVLNEKPKISVADKEILEKEMYFARERNGAMFVYFEKPVQDIEDGQWEVSTYNTFDCFPIDEELFPFITWESGKAWSKSELMKLKVID